MDAEETRKKLELSILEIIEEKLKNGQMDAERAKEIARMVLDKLHPPLTLEYIYTIAPTLDDHFAELAVAVSPIIAEHNKELSKTIATYAEKLIKEGQIDKATEVIKKQIEEQKA